MFNLSDKDLDNMTLVEGALALNQAIDADTDVHWANAELERLLNEAELELSHQINEQSKLDAFLRLFYCQWQFEGDSEAYFSSDNAFIDKVLRRRKGIPVSLGALLLYFGKKLGLPLEGVTFPTQFLVKVMRAGESASYINPFNGEYVSEQTLRAWLIGHDGPLAQLAPEHLASSDNPTVIGRWLALIKSAMLREERYTLALNCTDLALTFVPDDPYEIRDRGFIYQQLDCYQIAAIDYQFFIDQCPDDPGAELLKAQVSSMNDTHITLH